MDSIQKLSKTMKNTIEIAFLMIVGMVLCVWVFFSTDTIQSLIDKGFLYSSIQLPSTNVKLTEVQWTSSGFALMVVVSSLELFVLGYVVSQLRAVFKNYANGAIFTVGNAQHFRNVGVAAVAWGIFLKPALHTLSVLAVTLGNPAGERLLHVSYGSTQIGYVLIGLTIVIVSHVMKEGSLLKRDQALTI